jgi:hypothetical protein
MKHFITILSAIILMAISFTSCDNKKSQMENILVECVKSPSTYKTLGFEQSGVVTLADEVANRIEWFEYSVTSDKQMYENNEKYANDRYLSASFRKSCREDADKYKAKMEKGQKMLNHLKQISSAYPNEYNKPSFTIYKLTYESANGFGAVLKDYCYGRFDNDGNLVAIKLSEDSDWEIIGNY